MFTNHKGYGILKSQTTKNKHMKIKKDLLSKKQFLSLAIIMLTGVFAFSIFFLPNAYADQYQDQINALNAQNAQNQNNLNSLASVAASYQDAINKLQAQINAVQAQINANVAEQTAIQAKIEENKREIERQRTTLRADIKAMYVSGQMSTVEMLASSKNLNDYVNAETYRTAVQNKIQKTLGEISKLQAQLNSQKAQLEQLLVDQKAQQSKLDGDRAQQASLLAYNQSQQDAFNGQIASNKEKIKELRRQQAIANQRFIGQAGAGVNCGGGYPGSAQSPWGGSWGCNYAMDNNVDTWGMYNRQCVSYTAFKVAESGRNMPKWGLMYEANAKNWDDLAISAGIPVDQNPREGDVAVSNGGYYGHVMYVEHVYGDGTILISQYNAGWDGRYSEARISAAGLNYIHF